VQKTATKIRRRAWLSGLAAVLAAASSVASTDAPVRRFQIRYSVAITGLPPDARVVRVWVPAPPSDAWQTISNLSVQSPYPQTLKKEAEYGNSILYFEGPPPPGGSVDIVMTFDAARREYVNRPGAAAPAAAGGHEDARLLERFRKPDRLVPLEGKIAAVAREATQGRTTDLDKARAIYDYVASHLHYDKSGSGWGHGDAIWACDNKRGNCTDYHSLLIGMARALGIPAKFEIGLPVPADKEGPIGGYHCWAAFYLDGIGWVPVDSSEASKFPEKRDYFFGALDANRVRLSVGRDVTLEPRQDGGTVNYFVYPYVEVDGQPFAGVSQSFAFHDIAAAHAAPGRAPRALGDRD
jgi:transglutaminase-like putative cysteine protease